LARRMRRTARSGLVARSFRGVGGVIVGNKESKRRVEWFVAVVNAPWQDSANIWERTGEDETGRKDVSFQCRVIGWDGMEFGGVGPSRGGSSNGLSLIGRAGKGLWSGGGNQRGRF
jgi:hypothetical protein